MKYLLILLLIFISFDSFSQFSSEGVVLSIKSEEDAYQLSKKFISYCWGSIPLKVDDLSNGEIMFYGNTKVSLKPFIMSKDVDFFYTYQCRIRINDKISRIEITNIIFSGSSSDRFSHCNLQPTTEYEVESGCLSEDKQLELMRGLQDNIRKIVYSYESFLKSNNSRGIPNELKVIDISNNNLIYASAVNMMEFTRISNQSNNFILLGLSSITVGSLLISNNPKLGWFMIGLGGVCNLTSFGMRYYANRKMKFSGIALKNYSKQIK